MSEISNSRLKQLIGAMAGRRILVIGDIMLDQFLWGRVSRISPEAPVPVVDFERESFMPGGAANVARNLADLGVQTEMIGMIGKDSAGGVLKALLGEKKIDCSKLIELPDRMTTIKTRIVAHQQQVVRVDRESRGEMPEARVRRLVPVLESRLSGVDAVIVGDYGKGMVTPTLLAALKDLCRARGVWLSIDPKPVHHLDLKGVSLITPNRKEAFELAGIPDPGRQTSPLTDGALLDVANRIFTAYNPALLLVTLGEQGMLLCQRDQKPYHIPTVAQEVFDVSGAGDTVIGSFTAAIAAGASPAEAAIISNHAAGVVVGKVGTATVQPEELMNSFRD
jgi:rfaE bifunctional protein kinase chain/domain